MLFLVWSPRAQSPSPLSVDYSFEENKFIDTLTIRGMKTTRTFKLRTTKSSKNEVLGDWKYANNRAIFIPVLPLDGEQIYCLDYLDTQGTLRHQTLSPRVEKSTGQPMVTQIYPTASKLPENLLRFYIVFSEPMEEDSFLDHLSFYDEFGNSLRGVFLPSSFEYWNKERTKITLILDPGRVKTGLAAHNQYGRAIVAGRKYLLKIHTSCRSIQGQFLRESYTKEFRVTQEVRLPVDPNQWKVILPEIGTRQPLLIDFGRPLDHINAQTFITVIDPKGNPIEGHISLKANESFWALHPKSHWERENFTIWIDKTLEDICGNNLYSAFDTKNAAVLATKTKERAYRIHVFLN